MRAPHKVDIPCASTKCPKCGVKMVRGQDVGSQELRIGVDIGMHLQQDFVSMQILLKHFLASKVYCLLKCLKCGKMKIIELTQ